MKIRDYEYTHSDVEYKELWELLVKSYTITGKPRGLRQKTRPHNWFFARLENWKYASPGKPSTWFRSNVHLWRNKAGELVGFCISEYGNNGIHISIHPHYRLVEADMLSWIECIWAKDKEFIETYAYLYDTERQRLLTQLGYEDLGDDGYMRAYNVSKPYLVVDLPPGFRIRTLAENGDYSRRIATESKTFNSVFLNQEWFDGKRARWQSGKKAILKSFPLSVLPSCRIPKLIGDEGIRHAGTAYCISYMRALIHRANEEVG